MFHSNQCFEGVERTNRIVLSGQVIRRNRRALKAKVYPPTKTFFNSGSSRVPAPKNVCLGG